MKKIRLFKLLALVMVLILAFGTISVSAATTDSKSASATECSYLNKGDKVTVSKSKTNTFLVKKGDAFTLTLEKVKSGATVEWSTSKASVATVKVTKNKAKITPKKAGTVTIKATYDGKTYKSTVYVCTPIEWDAVIKNDSDSDSWETVHGTYCGQLKDGVPNGFGRFEASVLHEATKYAKEYTTVYKYEGHFADGLFDGIGTLKQGSLDFEGAPYYGNYDKGLYAPTLGQKIYSNYLCGDYEPFFVSLEGNLPANSMTKDDIAAIDSFAALSAKDIKAKAKALSHDDMLKNVSKFRGKLDQVKSAQVGSAYCDNGITYIYIWGNGDATHNGGIIYTLLYKGEIELEFGDKINFYGTPVVVDYSQYEGGDGRKSILEVAYIVEKSK